MLKNFGFLKRIKFFIIIAVFSFSVFTLSAKSVYAIPVEDIPHAMLTTLSTIWDKISAAAKTAWDNKQVMLDKAGSKALGSAIRTVLNNLAYDSATYLASGNKGQKPLFYTEGWGEFLGNAADNAAGTFLEELGRNGIGGDGTGQFNLCEPNFDVTLKIGMGLNAERIREKPECTFTEMAKNWTSEYEKMKSLNEKDFLRKFQGMFDPNQSDLGIALTLQTGIAEDMNAAVEEAEANRKETEGFIDITGIDGLKKSAPGLAKLELGDTFNGAKYTLGQYTGDALIDAANTFLNQYAITLIKSKLQNLGSNKRSVTNPFDGDLSWLDEDAAPYSGGITGAKEKFREILEPKFKETGSYDVLTKLTLCPTPEKAGPTECVITDNFRQAVSEEMTVQEAVDAGYLNKNGVFGFSSNGLEPSYQEGYPYRSMIILRKFRILPVGWEVAAQYIKDHVGAIGGTKNLQNLLDCFASEDAGDNWCRGLVDPNWVLTSPQNYCRREGAGPEIESEQIAGKNDKNTGMVSQRIISRNEEYCADEQSCIKEDSKGVCQAYGYCTEEKQGWEFDSATCEPIYNSCETFFNKDKKSISLLKNTLDFGSCTADTAGCRDFCEDYDWEDSRFTCTASGGDKIYLDADADACESESEGCHEFIRLSAGLGANLLKNSGFDEDYTGAPANFPYWGVIPGGDATTAEVYSGDTSLVLSAALTWNEAVGPADYEVSGKSYTLSFYARDCAGTAEMDGATTSVAAGHDWAFFSVTKNYLPSASQNDVNFSLPAPCVVDAIKLEAGAIATAYSNYRGNGLVYEKLAPDYLGCDGTDDPLACGSFVRTCTFTEVGCKLYTGTDSKMSVPAKVENQDQCPSQCVGYDDYLQTESVFDSGRTALLIPKNEKICSAESAGCDEFTNLDKLGSGAEALEYYSEMRQCRKPDGACSEFYTWEGSSESGYQLKVFSLEADAVGGDPAVTEDDSAECNITIYNLPQANPGYNSDCREFYNKSGDIFYHLYSKTISCSDDCHPYRRTEKNVDESIADAGSCGSLCLDAAAEGDHACWNPSLTQCFVCKNGGAWNVEQQACVYMAIPNEGKVCGANAAGCREYSGSAGGNMLQVINHSFETGTNQDWTGDLDAANPSNDSLIVGGHSLYVSGGGHMINLELGTMLGKDSAYVISFLAKGDLGGTLGPIYLGSTTGEQIPFAVSAPASNLGTDWRIYEFNLARLNNADSDYEISDQDVLSITASVNFKIDSIKLVEIVDRFYLIKQSPWNVPGACLRDIFGTFVGPHQNLGCEKYTDEDKKVSYLHDFTSLCSDSAVGCEVMIDTHNSSGYQSQAWNDDNGDNICDLSDGTDCTAVPADSLEYVVYDSDKQCNSDKKGCQRLGKPSGYTTNVFYTGVFLKNDPDSYDSAMCSFEQNGCEQWIGGSSDSFFFKDPGYQVCEYRQETGSEDWGWFKQKMKRCDVDLPSGEVDDSDPICLKDADCASGIPCIADPQDYPCVSFPDKTFGPGGANNEVYQPGTDGTYNWAGLCPAAKSGCEEYIDPVSRQASNLIINSDCSDIDGVDATAPVGDGVDCEDGWNPSATFFIQTVFLEPSTLYILENNDPSNSVSLLDCNGVRVLLDDNTLDTARNEFDVPAGNRRLFLSGADTGCVVRRTYSGSAIRLKKAIIDYQKGVSLENDCNGLEEYDNGCVLFNQRKIVGGNGTYLDFQDNNRDVDLTITSQPRAPETGTLDNNDSRAIVKVKPDRECSEWLACRSFVKDDKGNNICFDIGLCDQIDDNGNCKSFLLSEQKNQIYSGYLGDKISNLSGYSKVGYDPVSSLDSDLYPLAAMKQEGEFLEVNNGNFEFASENKEPFGWKNNDEWSDNFYSVVDNPVDAQNEGTGYAPDGDNFLKVGAPYWVKSEDIDVIGGAPYSLTAYINTINLISGNAYINIQFSDAAGTVIPPEPFMEAPFGLNWVYRETNFSAPLNASRANIIIRASSTLAGNFYVDNITIRPTLKSSQNEIVSQSCRLYPDNSSKSCDYFEDSGVHKKGWWGYCLEYDRYPGNTDACLLWYPVAKVKNDGLAEEGAGYAGKIPVYYTLEGGTTIGYVYKHTFSLYDDDSHICNVTDSLCPVGYTFYHDEHDCGFQCWDHYCYCIPDGEGLVIADGSGDSHEATTRGNPTSVNDGWYPYNGEDLVVYNNFFDADDVEIENTNPYASYLCNPYPFTAGATSCTLTQEQYRSVFYNSSKVVSTVTPTGKNKYWAGRTYQGSEYMIPDLKFLYDASDAPFGSILPPAPANNPVEWDANDDLAGNQPVLYGSYGATKVNSGQVFQCDTEDYDCTHVTNSEMTNFPYNYINYAATPVNYASSRLKRIFAQSYDIWKWVWAGPDAGQYTQLEDTAAKGWSPPTDLCTSGVRPVYDSAGNSGNGSCATPVGNCFVCPGPTCDYCAVRPSVANIKMNGGLAGNVKVGASDFANITFNSIVDQEQLPMVMYAVDWGDNDYTVVSGVEMRRRSNLDNPHSLYHLYSFWDMKSKQSVDKGAENNTVFCGNPGERPVNNTGTEACADVCPSADPNSCCCPADTACCVTQAGVKIKDNWGWCSYDGASPLLCPKTNEYTEYPNWIMTTEY